ncbi:MAG: transporter substrate-binding domain-containing protein [Lachnospiraceae bacterium]|nr:transporter substrate-binding domain-containing protein [Lachnospiraceae bacterium]MDE7271881.1 transporter substrate-binding domain-containing protein [Lachnospiraceae bacterium]
MKKLTTMAMAVTTALMLSVSLAGCGNSDAPAASSGDDTTSTAQTEKIQTESAQTEQSTTSESTQVTEAESGNSEVQNSESDLGYVKSKGTLVVGITDFEPMDYKDESGEWVGFDADMAKSFAESLGVAVEFIEIDWDNKILELEGKTIDCVWNGMTLTAEVTGAMECSRPYCNNAQVIVVSSEQADNFQEKSDLSQYNFAVEAGSAGEQQAIALELPHTPVKAQSDALMEVAAGTSDAAIIDSLMAAAMVGEGTGYADLTYTIGLNDEEYGVGFRKGSDLAAALNDFFTASYQDGSMIETAEKYGVQAAIVEQ